MVHLPRVVPASELIRSPQRPQFSTWRTIGTDGNAYPDISLMIKVTFAPRLQGKVDLMEGRLLKSLNQRLEVITEMTTEALLSDSHTIGGIAQPDPLWVARVSNDHRLIFRRTGADSIEVVDVVSHEDLNKFFGLRP